MIYFRGSGRGTGGSLHTRSSAGISDISISTIRLTSGTTRLTVCINILISIFIDKLVIVVWSEEITLKYRTITITISGTEVISKYIK